MTDKTLGYVELEWTCPTCGNKNPGMTKSCASCGAPQPQSAQFELGGQAGLITDAGKEAAAAAGADIYCPFCNTRNPSGAQVCQQCGADLKEGVRRESGRVLGGPVNAGAALKCPACGQSNPPGSLQCSHCGASLAAQAAPPAQTAAPPAGAFRIWMLLPVLAVLLAVCCLGGYLFTRTTNQLGSVTGTHWERSITILAQRQVTHQAWRDQVPAGAEVLGCEQKYRMTQSNPAPGAKEVCATQLVDQGNGSAKVVESCSYEVYDDYCQYHAMEWQGVDNLQASGSDLQPYWPQVNLAQGEREGDRSETYTATFNTRDGIKQFTTSDEALYTQLEPGSEWTLTLNALGGIVDISAP